MIGVHKAYDTRMTFGCLAAAGVAFWVSLAALPGAAEAQSFDPPQGCEGVVTIQHRGCIVTNLWTCEADAPGEQWIAVFAAPGPIQLKKVDENFQWLETVHPGIPGFRDGWIETQTEAPDPASLDELFSTGFDSYDFTIERSDGEPAERIVGYDQLTGEEVVIDGEPLLRTEYAYEQLGPDGEVLARRAGRQFVSERFRIFTFGESWDRDAPDEVRDSSPVEFVFPGEPGFMTATPKYDCGVEMTGYRP